MRCPNCGARVPDDRNDCPLCGCWLEDVPADTPTAVPNNKPLLIVLILILAALLVVTFLAFTGKLVKQDPNAVPAASVTAAVQTSAPTTAPTASAAPAATAAPTPSATPQPTETPVPTPTPTPVPTAPLNPGRYILPDSASRYLTEEELSTLSDRDLMLARNEIFARHGFIFTTQWIQGYFLTQGWYTGTTPAYQFDSSVFNDFERANVDLIVRIEAERAG